MTTTDPCTLTDAQMAGIAAMLPKATPEELAADEEFTRQLDRLEEAREAVRHAPSQVAQYMLNIALTQCAYDPYAMLLTLDPDGLLHVTDQTILRPADAEPPPWPEGL